MAVRPIRTVPDPILRQKAKRVNKIDKSTQKLVSDMRETLISANGVGLAAPQVGVSLRVIVISIPKQDQKNEDYCFINPEVIRRNGERMVREGCLSIPGYIGEIKRSEQVRVKGTDETGKEIKLRADGLLAEALEHEIDHLNGVLYVDHLETQDKLQKLEPEAKGDKQSEI